MQRWEDKDIIIQRENKKWVVRRGALQRIVLEGRPFDDEDPVWRDPIWKWLGMRVTEDGVLWAYRHKNDNNKIFLVHKLDRKDNVTGAAVWWHELEV